MAFFNDISLGQYYPADSFIHKLDPRTKLVATMLLMTSLLISFDPFWLGTFVFLAFLMIVFSKIPAKFIIRNLRPFIWLFLITILVHIFSTSGRSLVSIPLLHLSITFEGLKMGLFYSLRLALLIIFAALLTLSTSPLEITDAMEKMAAPLKRFRLPVHEIVMMLTLSLRFIPTLMEEAQRLKNAQLSRGATFEGSLLRRIRSVIPLILPLFISAFRRAEELALAMDARCYTGGEGRTSFKQLEFRRADYLVLGLATGLCAFSLFFQTAS